MTVTDIMAPITYCLILFIWAQEVSAFDPSQCTLLQDPHGNGEYCYLSDEECFPKFPDEMWLNGTRGCSCYWRQGDALAKHDKTPTGIHIQCRRIQLTGERQGSLHPETVDLYLIYPPERNFLAIFRDPNMRNLEKATVVVDQLDVVFHHSDFENVPKLKNLRFSGRAWSIESVEANTFTPLFAQSLRKLVFENSRITTMWIEDWDYLTEIKSTVNETEDFGFGITNPSQPVSLQCDCNVWNGRSVLGDILCLFDGKEVRITTDPNSCEPNTGKQVSAATTRCQHNMISFLLVPVTLLAVVQGGV